MNRHNGSTCRKFSSEPADYFICVSEAKLPDLKTSCETGLSCQLSKKNKLTYLEKREECVFLLDSSEIFTPGLRRAVPMWTLPHLGFTAGHSRPAGVDAAQAHSETCGHHTRKEYKEMVGGAPRQPQTAPA